MGGVANLLTCGPLVSMPPLNAFEREKKVEVVHMCPHRLHHLSHLSGPKRCTAGVKIRSGPHVGTCGRIDYISPAATESPTLQSGRQNQRSPTCGPIGYITTPLSWIRNALERGARLKVAHMLLHMPNDPSRLSGSQCFSVRDKSELAPLWADWLHHRYRLGGSATLQSGGQN